MTECRHIATKDNLATTTKNPDDLTMAPAALMNSSDSNTSIPTYTGTTTTTVLNLSTSLPLTTSMAPQSTSGPPHAVYEFATLGSNVSVIILDEIKFWSQALNASAVRNNHDQGKFICNLDDARYKHSTLIDVL